MTRLSAPTAQPGRVVRNGDTSFPSDAYIYLPVQQALQSHTGEDVLWTDGVHIELPIRVSKFGIGAATPVTVIEAFAEAVRKHATKPALAYKPPALKADKFRVLTWQEYWNQSCLFGKALISLGHNAKDRVIIMGIGTAFWLIAHFGTIFANGICGSSYTTNGMEATEYILSQSGCIVAVVDTVENMEKVFAARQSGRCPNLKHIVMFFDDPPDESSGPAYRRSVWRWFDFMRLGHSVNDAVLTERMGQQTPGMCCELVYTSGTTGIPKAVMLSHDNLVWTTFSLLQMVHFTPAERIVSFLPLSHIASQIIDLYIPILSGCCTYFAQPDALKGSLIVTLHEVRPTYLFGVPRVYERMQERMSAVASTSSALTQLLSSWVKQVGFNGTVMELNGLRPPLVYQIVKATILKRVKRALGLDHCKAIASGAAPLQPSTQDYFLSLGLPICNMYGMSESCGPQTSNAAWPGWFKRQTAGVALPGTEMWIDRRDSTQKDDDEGEVCYRGRNIFMGYYKDRAATMSTLDSNGFLHSGDLGYVDAEGFLRITGRAKELLITAGGENVAPVPIEDRVKEEMPFISNCMVVGDGRKFLSLLICLKSVPDNEGHPSNSLDPLLAQLLKDRKSTSRTVYEASQDPMLKHFIDEGLKRVNQRAVSNAQHVTRFRILPQDLTVLGGELTPTLKLKRKTVLEKYASVVDSMYREAEKNHRRDDDSDGHHMAAVPTSVSPQQQLRAITNNNKNSTNSKL